MSDNSTRKITFKALYEWLQSDINPPCLIDVRENEEIAIASLPYPFIHLPLSKINSLDDNIISSISEFDSLVIICHAGIRSMNFAFWLLDKKIKCNVWNLAGGIDAWSLQIDSSIQRY